MARGAKLLAFAVFSAFPPRSPVPLSLEYLEYDGSPHRATPCCPEGDGEYDRVGCRAGLRAVQEPSAVLLVAEGTSVGTAHRDRAKKTLGYARAGIPVCLLIHRDEGEVVVHFEPSGGGYGRSTTYGPGLVVPLPDPLGFELNPVGF